MDLEELKQKAKDNEATITMYLTALLIYAIYQTNYQKYRGKRPINICIPVDLRKYFDSDTMSNFFSYITVGSDFENYTYSFNQVLEIVKKEIKEKLVFEEINKTLSANVKLGTNGILKRLPLVFKQVFVRIGNKIIKNSVTLTFSNVGKIEMESSYSEYIDKFIVLLSPEAEEKLKCGVCSYENKLVLTFTSILVDISIENKFYELLKQENINIRVEGNGVSDVIS